jgi:choline kinase
MTTLAVILAAGQGTRLLPLTADTPKCLIDVGGRPLLGHMLDALAAAGTTRAIVVTGHRAERVESYLAAHPPPLRVSTARNAAYATTNNAASLEAARHAIGAEAFVLCDGDVIFSESPLDALLASAEPCTLVVDRGASLGDEEMKVRIDARGLVAQLSKRLDPTVCVGESIGVQKLGGPALARVWDEVNAVVRADAATAYYEDVFQRLIDDGVRFGTSEVATDGWMQRADHADRAAARRRFGAEAGAAGPAGSTAGGPAPRR